MKTKPNVCGYRCMYVYNIYAWCSVPMSRMFIDTVEPSISNQKHKGVLGAVLGDLNEVL